MNLYAQHTDRHKLSEHGINTLMLDALLAKHSYKLFMRPNVCTSQEPVQRALQLRYGNAILNKECIECVI